MSDNELIERLKGAGSWFADFARILFSAFKGMGKDNITIIASGMVYSTLIAFVPCLTFLFSFLAGFGVAETLISLIGEWLFATFGPDTGGELFQYLQQFSSNAMSLGIVGLASFIVTGLLLVNKIYNTVNQIFHTRPTSGAVRRFTMFLTFLLMSCFFISASFVLSNMLGSFVYKLTGGHALVRGPKVLKHVVYTVIGCGILFMIYKYVPRAKINATSALAGSATGIVALWVAVRIFGEVTSRMVRYSIIYGSLASLFIALLFLYVAWYIILFCAEIVYVHQFRPERSILLGHPETPAVQISVAVNMILLIAERYRKGHGPMSLKELMRRLGVPSVTLNSYLSDFEDAKLIMCVNATRSAYIPAKPLDQIMLTDIVYTVYGSSLDDELVDTIGEAVALDFLNKGLEGIERMTVENLLERI